MIYKKNHAEERRIASPRCLMQISSDLALSASRLSSDRKPFMQFVGVCQGASCSGPRVQLAPTGGGWGAETQGANWRTHLSMKRRSANPKNLPPSVTNSLNGPRNGTSKPHHAYFRGPQAGLAKTILPWGLARVTRPNLSNFGGFTPT